MSMVQLLRLIKLVLILSLNSILVGCLQDCHFSMSTIDPVEQPTSDTTAKTQKIELQTNIECKIWE
jgi:hypothetical protein